ncbi:penicillin-binding protein 1B [Cocleimonas flava]|uniref:Penicillin-binding protein 1B n=1 Tax=Cocleimonas flava TaxID=634765 RepID=A0A4R1F260_9GAMM|nr:penicillin-binding protein 1B [Cocleimonas flava]TCJ88217.1 penicillin-binding protein 1B [Cocleimonas flava]
MSDNKDKPFDTLNLSEVSDIVTDSADDAVDVENTVDVDNSTEHDDLEPLALAEEDADLTEQAVPPRKRTVFGIILGVFKGLWRVSRIAILIGIVIGSLLTAAYVLQQDELVRSQFEGKRWALPARVFARPLEIYEGQSLKPENLQKELQLLGYSYVTHLVGTGQFTKDKKGLFSIQTRGFKFAQDQEISRRISIQIKKDKIVKLSNTESNEPLTLMRLEPVLIGNFYPQHNEDRVLVKLDDVTPLLAKGLVAVEDKKFYDHFGVNPKSIVRAVLANAEAGRRVQGASTLTQQLVKNFFLTSEKSYKRKAQEAIMAMLLEVHYDKDEILEAYLNEIYLGQNGKRAIHGFGLASQFYFNKPISELSTEQVALLIGLAKGPSVYNPRSHPKRAMERRNLVLDVMAREGVLEEEKVAVLKKKPLGVNTFAPPSVSPFPSYLELVRKQLQRDYNEKDLNSEGLLIFTSMDPIVQITAEKVLKKRIEQLEKSKRMEKDKLNGAMVVSSAQGSEVLAVVGGRDARFAGYNRALSASRQIGSLIKPVVYLSAIESGEYTLASPVDAGPVTVRLSKTKTWKPKNYSGKDLGIVPFEEGLVKSLNTPTVRIGITLGLEQVIRTLHNLGLNHEVTENPSLLLGALQLTPMEVQQIYQTLAAGGSYTPLKAIRSVMNSYGETLKSYPLKVRQVAKEESVYLLTYAMNKVTKEGTARYLSHALPAWKNSAGKTGTTNKNVDSWYAGFTGQHVVSVWVGRDDNKPTGFTGAAGALRVWADFMKEIPTKPFKPVRPKGIKFMKVDTVTGLIFNPSCGKSHTVPFFAGTEPNEISECVPEIQYEISSESTNNSAGAPVWQGNNSANRAPNNQNRQNRNQTDQMNLSGNGLAKKKAIQWSDKQKQQAPVDDGPIWSGQL